MAMAAALILAPTPLHAQLPSAPALAHHRPSPLPFYLEDAARRHQESIGFPEGDLDLKFLDALIPADGAPVVLLREYRSARQRAGVFGAGWVSNLDLRLDVDPASGEPAIQEIDGRTTRYEARADNRFAPILTPVVKHDLLREPDGHWTRTWENGLAEKFDRSGRLESVTRSGDRIDFQYPDDRARAPIAATDALGRALRFAYADGLLAETTDPLGRKTSYRYQDRRLVRTTDALGRKVAFHYEEGRLDAMVLPSGASLRVRYAADGTVQEMAGPGALRTTFAWASLGKGAGAQLTLTLANGTSEVLQFAAGLLRFQDWGLRDPAVAGADSRTVGLEVRRSDAAGASATALAAGDKVLLKSLAAAALVLDGNGAQQRIIEGRLLPATDSDAVLAALQAQPEWRTRLAPGAFRSAAAGIERDAAGRPVALPLGGAGKETWEWDAGDRLVAWTDAQGRKTSYDYDADNHLIAIAEDGHVAAQAEFDASGWLAKVRDASGGEMRFTHDGAGNMLAVEGSRGGRIAFSYDASNRLATVSGAGEMQKLTWNARGLLDRVTDAAGGSRSFSYDDAGKLIAALDEHGDRLAYDYDADGRMSRIVSNGASIEFGYSADGTTTRIRSKAGHEITDTRTAAGRSTTLKLAGGPEISARYDNRGLPLAIDDSTGGATRYAYDAAGRLISRESASGATSSYRYDDSGKLVQIRGNNREQSFQYDGEGETDVLVDNGRTSKERYDRDGRLVARSDADGNETRYEYTPSGALSAILRPGGARLDYDRDAAGRVLAVRHSDHGQTAAVSYGYDSLGRVIRYTREDGTSETYAYDAAGHLVERVSPLGNHYRYRYDDRDRILSIEGPFGTEGFTYDAAGRLAEHSDPVAGNFRLEYSDQPPSVTVTDPSGARTRVELNAQGQPVEIEDPASGKLLREYDKAGRLTAFVDPNGNRTTWTYDDQARSVERRTPAGKRYRYRYDARGNLTEIDRPSGQVVQREYDAAGRLARVAVGGGETWSYHYDSRGRLESLEGPPGKFAYEYDDLDRVTGYRDAFGRTASIGYDAIGRRQTLDLPDGQRLRYSYNAQGLLGAVETKSGAIKYAYDEAGRLSTITYPNGVVVTQEYAAGTRLSSVAATRAGGAVLFHETYDYDARGNVVAVTDSAGDLGAPDDVRTAFRRATGVTRFSYDALDRVVAAIYPDGAEEHFDYDADGDLIRAVTTRTDAAGATIRAETPYAYDADQSLIAQGPYQASPDADGNFCGDWNRSGCDVKYDALGRLTAWHDQAYGYDGEGRLLEWRDGKGEGARYTYLGASLIGEAGPKGLARTYVPGLDERQWAALEAGSDAYYPVRSANGSLLAVTDEHGDIVASCRYRIYGVALSWSKSAGEPGCEFAGGRMQGPGFWFGSRVLHGIGARFISPDPTGPDKDGNLYSYALDNPLRFVDATGTTSTSLGQQPPLYRQLLQEAGVPQNAPAVRQALIDQFKQTAATAPTEAARQEAQAISLALENNIVPLNLSGAASSANRGSYDMISRAATTNLERIAQSDPANFWQGVTGNVVHEVGGHGLNGGDVKLWMENPDAPIMKAWAQAGVEPVFGIQKPYSPFEEMNAFMNQWRYGDPTLGGKFPAGAAASESEARDWITNFVGKQYLENEGSAYYRENVKQINKNMLDLIGEQDFYTKTFSASSNQAVSGNIEALREARAAQAIAAAERLPITAAAETAASRGVVESALAREAVELGAAAEKGLARRLAESMLSAAGRYFPGQALKDVLLPGLLELAEPLGTALLVKDVAEMAVKAAAWAGRQLGNLLAKPLEDAFKQLDALNTEDETQKKKKRRAAADSLVGPAGGALMGDLLLDASYPAGQVADASPGQSPSGTPPSGGSQSGNGAGQAQSGTPSPGGSQSGNAAGQAQSGTPPPAGSQSGNRAGQAQSGTPSPGGSQSGNGAGQAQSGTPSPGGSQSGNGAGQAQSGTPSPGGSQSGNGAGQAQGGTPSPGGSQSGNGAGQAQSGNPSPAGPQSGTGGGQVASAQDPRGGTSGAGPAAPAKPAPPARPTLGTGSGGQAQSDDQGGVATDTPSADTPGGQGGAPSGAGKGGSFVGAMNGIGRDMDSLFGNGDGGGGTPLQRPQWTTPPDAGVPQPPQPPTTEPGPASSPPTPAPAPPAQPPQGASNQPSPAANPTPPDDDGLPTAGLPSPPLTAPPAPAQPTPASPTPAQPAPAPATPAGDASPGTQVAQNQPAAPAAPSQPSSSPPPTSPTSPSPAPPEGFSGPPRPGDPWKPPVNGSNDQPDSSGGGLWDRVTNALGKIASAIGKQLFGQ